MYMKDMKLSKMATFGSRRIMPSIGCDRSLRVMDAPRRGVLREMTDVHRNSYPFLPG